MGAKKSGEIDLLEPLAVARAARHIADEQDHRLRVLHRHVHADGGIGGARPASDEGNPRPPAPRRVQRPVGAGHERRAALVAAGDDLDLRLVEQRVEHPSGSFRPAR